jgi:hypothetical protein
LVVNQRERVVRDLAIVEGRRRNVSAAKLAETYGMTVRRVQQIAAEWDDLPSIPKDGVRVDSGTEVRRTLVAFEQAIADLGEIVGDVGTPVHVRLGAISRTLDAHERRLRLMAAAGYVSRNLAAPLVEQEMVALIQTVVDLMRRHGVADEVIGELITLGRQRSRAPLAIEAETVAA